MRLESRFFLISFVITLLFFYTLNQGVVLSNGNTNVEINQAPWPTNGWSTSISEEQGMDSDLLDQSKSYITMNNLPIKSFVIIKNGYLVYEYYPDPAFDSATKIHIWSVTKAFTTSLIGIAHDQGLIPDISEKILSIFSNWTITNPSWQDELTVENLLEMRSGFVQVKSSQYKNQSDSVQYLLDRDMITPPDTEWSYNHGDAHLLSAMLTIRSNKSASEFAQDNLFNHLGISDFNWEADLQGINIGSSGISLSPLDMAKFGYLYLQNGTWDGRQVISSEWIATATSELSNYTETNDNEGYGYSWGVNPREGYYSTYGKYGQAIFVYPDNDLIIVYTSNFSGETEIGAESLLNIINWYVLPSIQREQDVTTPVQSTKSSEVVQNETPPVQSTKSSEVVISGNSVLMVLFASASGKVVKKKLDPGI